MGFFRSRKKPEAAKPEPKKTQKRLKLPKNQRNFAAAMNNRLNASWSSQSQGPDQVILNNLTSLRARSRDQAFNNDYARKFLSMVQNNVIGQKGIVIQSKVLDENGDAPDLKAQKAIEDAFKDWGSKHADIKGKHTWLEIQSLAIRTIAQDGEVLIRKHGTGKYGYQLELIDPELLDVTYNTQKENGNVIRFGIEFDSIGRVVAYHITQQENGIGINAYQSSYNKKDPKRVLAQDIFHLYLSDFIDQKRGLPWMSSALQRMKMLTGYEDSSLVAARAGASKMGFYQSETGDEYYGDGEENGEILEDFEPGKMSELPSGMTFQAFDPDYPKGEFEAFKKACLRGIASGLLVSYNTVANDLEGVNYSSMRHGALEEREVWKALHKWLIEKLIQPVYEEWLDYAMLSKQIQLSTSKSGLKSLSRSYEEYLPATYQGRRWDWVDPLKDIQAKEKEISLGITTPSAVIREKGGDPQQVWEELKQDLETLNEMGISIGVGHAKPEHQKTEQPETGT